MKISNGLIWFLHDEVVQRLNEVINFLTGFFGQGCQDRAIKTSYINISGIPKEGLQKRGYQERGCQDLACQ
jgi:hypothetical protein